MTEYKKIIETIDTKITEIKNSTFVGAICVVIYLAIIVVSIIAFAVLPPQLISTYLNQGKDEGLIAITWWLFWCCVLFVMMNFRTPETDADKKNCEE